MMVPLDSEMVGSPSLVFVRGSFDADFRVPSHALVNESILHCSYQSAYSSAYLVIQSPGQACPQGWMSFDG